MTKHKYTVYRKVYGVWIENQEWMDLGKNECPYCGKVFSGPGARYNHVYGRVRTDRPGHYREKGCKERYFE